MVKWVHKSRNNQGLGVPPGTCQSNWDDHPKTASFRVGKTYSNQPLINHHVYLGLITQIHVISPISG